MVGLNRGDNNIASPFRAVPAAEPNDEVSKNLWAVELRNKSRRCPPSSLSPSAAADIYVASYFYTCPEPVATAAGTSLEEGTDHGRGRLGLVCFRSFGFAVAPSSRAALMPCPFHLGPSGPTYGILSPKPTMSR